MLKVFGTHFMAKIEYIFDHLTEMGQMMYINYGLKLQPINITKTV